MGLTHRGMNLRDAIRLADDLGVENDMKHGTGERVFRYRPLNLVCIQDVRRKDANRALTVLLRKAERHRGGG